MIVDFVDKNDEIVGSGEVKEAKANGFAYRIARVLVSNSQGELLIQKRSDNHPSLPGRWDMSSAGHVDKGESYLEAAQRETEEEIGLKSIQLKEVGKVYTEETDEPTLKKRFNMIYSANYDGDIDFDEREVSEVRWISLGELDKWMEENPDDFTEGFVKGYEFYKASR